MVSHDVLTNRVFSSFKERCIPAKRDAIETALNDSEAVDWVSKHLTAENLLSQEELALYNKLEASGILQTILLDTELYATRPFLEDDLRSAITALEASTITLQEQTSTLSAQCETLRSQSSRQEKVDQDRIRDIARLRRKHEAEKQTIITLANELSHELEASFTNTADKTGTENRRILSSLSSRLKQDDKTLAELEICMSRIKSKGNNASTVKRAAHLSAILADYSANEIHCRLDRLYLETIQRSNVTLEELAAGDDSIAAIEEELESLYPEIEVLAEMTTKQQFMQPILREIHNEHTQLREASHQKLEQILDILIEMTLLNQDLKKQLIERESWCELMEQFGVLYQAQLASQLAPQPLSRRESLRRRSLQAGVFLEAARNPIPTPDQPMLENLLRRIGVSSNSVLRPRAENGGADELHEKRYHMAETISNLGGVVPLPAMAHLACSDKSSQLLSSALLANSHYETSLRDAGQEEALSGLEVDLASLQRGLQGLDLDVVHRRDKYQDRFLERWG